MSERRYIVVASATAWVDPSVQVHDAGCNHGLMRWYDEEWIGLGPFADEEAVFAASENERQRINASGVAWCDCALLGVR